MTIESAKYALEKAKLIERFASDLVLAAQEVVGAYSDNRRTFAQGVESTNRYAFALDHLNELTRRQLCAADLLDPHDDELKQREEHEKRKAEAEATKREEAHGS
jgi:hypothetical protein